MLQRYLWAAAVRAAYHGLLGAPKAPGLGLQPNTRESEAVRLSPYLSKCGEICVRSENNQRQETQDGPQIHVHIDSRSGGSGKICRLTLLIAASPLAAHNKSTAVAVSCFHYMSLHVEPPLSPCCCTLEDLRSPACWYAVQGSPFSGGRHMPPPRAHSCPNDNPTSLCA